MKAEYDFHDGKRGAVIPQPGKTRITIYVDNDVLATFRERAENSGRGYQAVMNQSLREYLAQSRSLVDEPTLRSKLIGAMATVSSFRRTPE